MASPSGMLPVPPPPPHIAPLLDLAALRRDGYLVLPEVVSRDELDSLQAHCDLMYARHHTEVWGKGLRAKVQTPDSENPRVQFERVITPSDADIFDFICGSSTLGVCHELMSGGDPSVEVVPVETAMLTNPVHDYGPWKWHRECSMLRAACCTCAACSIETHSDLNRDAYAHHQVTLFRRPRGRWREWRPVFCSIDRAICSGTLRCTMTMSSGCCRDHICTRRPTRRKPTSPRPRSSQPALTVAIHPRRTQARSATRCRSD